MVIGEVPYAWLLKLPDDRFMTLWGRMLSAAYVRRQKIEERAVRLSTDLATIERQASLRGKTVVRLGDHR